MIAKRNELLRLSLLWAEGLLCRCCHVELAIREELDAGLCLGCVRFFALTELDVTRMGKDDHAAA